MQMSEESLSQNRKLSIVFQWISFFLRSSNDTRFVTKSVQKITFFNLKIFFLSFFFVIWSITSSYFKIGTFDHSAITYSLFEVFWKFENQERSLNTWIVMPESRMAKFLRDETVVWNADLMKIAFTSSICLADCHCYSDFICFMTLQISSTCAASSLSLVRVSLTLHTQ